MATEQVMRQGVSNRVRALAALLLTAVALLIPSTLSAQTNDPQQPPARPRARDAMRAARESYGSGDYEAAAAFLKDADANKQQLSPDERTDLANQIKLNNTALESRRKGGARLQLAEEDIKKGNLREAADLVKAENANQYLSAADKQLLTQLTDQLKAKAAAKAAATADTSKEDYSTLVRMARTALQRGDYDTAELYSKQAEKKAGMVPSWPWSDSPAKVLHDVQAARLKAAQTAALPDGKQDSPSVLTKVKSMFSPNSPMPKSDADNMQLVADKNVVAGPAATAPQPGQQMVSKETLEARMLRDKAIEALQRDDLVAAKKYAEQAKAKMDPNSWWERPNPDELLRDINLHLAQAAANPASTGDPKKLPPYGTPVAVDASNARARLKEARDLYNQGKMAEADRLCGQVAAVKTSWGLFEDNPEKLRGEIKSARQKADKAESLKVLAEARKMLAAGNLQEALRRRLESETAPRRLQRLGRRRPARKGAGRHRRRRGQAEKIRRAAADQCRGQCADAGKSGD